MKLKKWVEILLLILTAISFIFITYNLEVSVIPCLIGTAIFLINVSIISEYGTIINNLIAKLDKLYTE